MKIALVGTVPASRYLAPFGDPSWEIWANGIEHDQEGTVFSSLPRIDKFFCFNVNMLWPEHKSHGIQTLIWLEKQTFELWMQDQRFIARAKSYPIAKMVRMFGSDFFAGGASYMMAKAIADIGEEGKPQESEIGLFGTDLSSHGERIRQRQCLKFFIWFANQAGIKVSAPIESDILEPMPLYGYIEGTARGRKLAAKRVEIEQNIARLRDELESKKGNLHLLEGALEELGYHELVSPGNPELEERE